MFRNLFPKLGELFAPDRFADWPDADSAASPTVDLAARKVGPLPFGASFEDARAFGRPDRYDKLDGGGHRLLYARRGLELEFYAGQGFAYAGFHIAPDRHDPDHPDLAHTCVRFVDGTVFDSASTEADLRRRLGSPTSTDRDDDETVLTFTHADLSIECELRPGAAGTLKRLNLFPA
jgi:hypothetical protein